MADIAGLTDLPTSRRSYQAQAAEREAQTAAPRGGSWVTIPWDEVVKIDHA